MCIGGALYSNPLDDLARRVERCLDRTLAHRPAQSVQVYFRADDIAVPSPSLARLMTLFQTHRIPLALAVVPAWLTRPRWDQLRRRAGSTPELWCWHQHGWRHRNHAPRGNSGAKKAEFGDHRPFAAMVLELRKGFERLDALLGAKFEPILTPPWNRMGSTILPELESIGFQALSRDAAQPRVAPSPLPEFPVHVDLHTGKAPDPVSARGRLLQSLAAALDAGTCGIMIHHQRMDAAAFAFLDFLLAAIKRRQAANPVALADLLPAAR